jgi:hypothetical protein
VAIRRYYLQVKERDLDETNPAGTLILDFQAPELLENKFQLLKSPTVWYFVRVALEN